MALIFPIVFGYWGTADFAFFFFAIGCLAIAVAGQATRTGNSQMHASFVDLGLCDGMLQSFKIFIFSLKYSLVWNEIKNVKQKKIYRLSSLGGVKEIVWKVLQFS